MSNFTEFLDMGGYAAFVWPSYIIAAVVMVVLAIASWRELVTERATLEKLEAAHGSRRSSGQEGHDGR